MTISYNWLSEYLPDKIDPEKLSKILTSIGLEVESLKQYESIRGGLEGLVVGHVVECVQHPNADKLKVTKVNAGNGALLQIVCGAPNVAVGQKVVVAKIGTTIYPSKGESVTMKIAKIRGVESQGMICAEDEIGIGENHDGIVILPDTLVAGTSASEYFHPYKDWVFEIGLTPNRMDAMSHLGVARDVCAYLTHHNKTVCKPKVPLTNTFKPDNVQLPIKVTIANLLACQRYSGISIKGVTVKESPEWLQNRLKAIGQRPINNIVDLTNYVLHETGQPLHAFDADEIAGKEIIVKNLPEGTIFTTLDEKERKLGADDLMICDAKDGICIAGVFGGTKSGVKANTQNIFLESAWFNPVNIRKTSVKHGLRTDAASHFEKGVDISNTVNVLKRTALLIKEIAGGSIASEVVDVYPNPREKAQVALKYHYLKKLSGKNYHHDTITKILESLGFEIIKQGMDELWVAAPYSKPDITLPADVVEEIVRIDGLDNIEIPASITITPANETLGLKENLKEKLANFLTGLGFNEILTNSITNSHYYTEKNLSTAVKMINSLSAELDILRPSMLQTGLECIAYNIHRKNNNLQFFEFGKIYSVGKTHSYKEIERFCIYITGYNHYDTWRQKAKVLDFFDAKGLAEAIGKIGGFSPLTFETPSFDTVGLVYPIKYQNRQLGNLIVVDNRYLQNFEIKQPVYLVDFDFMAVLSILEKQKIVYEEVPKFPVVRRDLAIITDKSLAFESVVSTIKKINLSRLQEIRLFDVFESEKLGKGKKSFAVNFTFIDIDKTLTDKEIDDMMRRIMETIQRELQAEIRKS